MSTFFGFVFTALAVFSFAFVLWKKLKEDYANELIFKFTLALLAGIGLGAWIASVWAPDFVFWASLAFGIAFGFYFIRKWQMRFFELIDGVSFAALVFMLILYLGQVVKILPSVSYFVFARGGLSLLLLGFYAYFLRSYRRFSLYPSGKVGFAGLATLALFFLGRAVIFGAQPLHLGAGLVNVIISVTLFAILARIIWQRKS